MGNPGEGRSPSEGSEAPVSQGNASSRLGKPAAVFTGLGLSIMLFTGQCTLSINVERNINNVADASYDRTKWRTVFDVWHRSPEFFGQARTPPDDGGRPNGRAESGTPSGNEHAS